MFLLEGAWRTLMQAVFAFGEATMFLAACPFEQCGGKQSYFEVTPCQRVLPQVEVECRLKWIPDDWAWIDLGFVDTS